MGNFDKRRNDRSRNSGFNRDFRNNSEPRKKHKAVCSECKKECEVPFEPTKGKPVYCDECWAKRRRPRF